MEQGRALRHRIGYWVHPQHLIKDTPGAGGDGGVGTVEWVVSSCNLYLDYIILIYVYI